MLISMIHLYLSLNFWRISSNFLNNCSKNSLSSMIFTIMIWMRSISISLLEIMIIR